MANPPWTIGSPPAIMPPVSASSVNAWRRMQRDLAAGDAAVRRQWTLEQGESWARRRGLAIEADTLYYMPRGTEGGKLDIGGNGGRIKGGGV